MAPAKSADPKDLLIGGGLQCLEAITVGMPFEVWKTHMGSFRNDTTAQALRNIYNKGGIAAFWKGWQPKMVESALKGGILMFAKESIIRTCHTMGVSDVSAGLIGGFGGGVAQVSVMGPCTFLVTAAVTSSKDSTVSTFQRVSETYKTSGIAGFYRGGVALMLRQGSNWASRQGITEYVRGLFRKANPGRKLSVGEEAIAGIIGGALSTWNQPFEVLRIQAQFAAAKGLPPQNIVVTTQAILKEHGVAGLFKGIVPRIGLGVAQTLYLITVPHLLKSAGII